MNWLVIIAIVAHTAWLLFMISKLRTASWRQGVLEGYMATKYPGRPEWKKARAVLDELQAAVLAKSIEEPIREGD